VPARYRGCTEGHEATARLKEKARVMYQMNGIGMAREYRQALLGVAGGERLAHPKREEPYAGRVVRDLEAFMRATRSARSGE
jgi:hypothetical protein